MKPQNSWGFFKPAQNIELAVSGWTTGNSTVLLYRDQAAAFRKKNMGAGIDSHSDWYGSLLASMQRY